MARLPSEEEAESAIADPELGRRQVDEFIQPHLERLQKNYAATVNRLWLGNAGAALATLSFLGVTWQANYLRFKFLWPFSFFIFGLILLGVSEFVALIKDASAVYRNQGASSIWDVIIGDAESPLEQLVLSIGIRSMLQLASAVSFIAGLISGLLVFVLASLNN